MAHFKTGHEEKVENAKQPDIIDLNSWEKSTIGLGENNILQEQELVVSDNFRYDNMDVKMVIWSSTLAKHMDKSFKKNHADVSKEVTYLMDDPIQLEPLSTVVRNPARSGESIRDNESLYAKIVSTLVGISGETLVSPIIELVGNKTMTQDLRHMFAKGYMALMSYNLSVVSNCDEYEYDDLVVDIKKGVTPEEKLDLLVTTPIVVDVDNFTDRELWLLVEMCCEYPMKRFGGCNIYNNIRLEEDTLSLVSSDAKFEMEDNPDYGSPELMWYILVNIAIKFDAMDDLRQVVKDFRGLPGLLRSIRKYTGESVFTLKYPRSYSIKKAVDPTYSRNTFVTGDSGYYATSKCVMVDLMLSNMLEMSVFNLIEELGMLGTISCPSGNVMTDAYARSNLLNMGIMRDGSKTNELIRKWVSIRSCEIPIGFGGCLMKYVLKIASEIRRGQVC